jgi:hypothetical protein
MQIGLVNGAMADDRLELKNHARLEVGGVAKCFEMLSISRLLIMGDLLAFVRDEFGRCVQIAVNQLLVNPHLLGSLGLLLIDFFTGNCAPK